MNASHKADRIRWNMGQMPGRYLDLAYLRRVVSDIDGHIRVEILNAKNASVICAPRVVSLEEKIATEWQLQQLELLLSEIELCFTWGLFPFQQECTD